MIQHKSVSWWLEMVKIARKGFEVLSKGEGQATTWWLRNLARVKKKVLAFSWSTNQTMTATFEVENQILDESLKWLDTFGVNSYLLNTIKSHAQDGYVKEKIKIDIMTPSLDEDWKLWQLVWRESTQVVRPPFSFDLELLGMSYY
jgi:hypothetical protein